MAKVETGNYKLQHSSMTMRDLSSSTKNIVKDNAPASLELIIKCRNNDYAIITDGWLLQQMMKYMVKAIVLKYSSGFLDIEFHTMANMVKISVAHVGKYAVDSIFARRGDSGQEYDEASVSVCHKIAGLLKGRCYIDNSHTLGSRIIFEHPASIY